MNYRPIGSTFQLEANHFKPVTLKVEADASVELCERCFFKKINCAEEPFGSQLGPCVGGRRGDRTNIHFVNVTSPDHDC